MPVMLRPRDFNDLLRGAYTASAIVIRVFATSK